MHHPADGAAPSEPENTQPAQPLHAGVPIGTGHGVFIGALKLATHETSRAARLAATAAAA